jgi:hypothetical protein
LRALGRASARRSWRTLGGAGGVSGDPTGNVYHVAVWLSAVLVLDHVLLNVAMEFHIFSIEKMEFHICSVQCGKIILRRLTKLAVRTMLVTLCSSQMSILPYVEWARSCLVDERNGRHASVGGACRCGWHPARGCWLWLVCSPGSAEVSPVGGGMATANRQVGRPRTTGSGGDGIG